MKERSGLRAEGSGQFPTAHSPQPTATIQRFVIKIGSSVLTDERGRLLPERLERLVEQIVACSNPAIAPRPSAVGGMVEQDRSGGRDVAPMGAGVQRPRALPVGLHEHRQPVIVSSGAIACGMARLKLTKRPTSLAQLQACAAIGQGELMHLYTVAFGRHGVTTAQVLLTQDDLADRARFRNAKQTLLTLLHRRVVPIVNENDTVAVEEITFGDNDRLAALVAVAIDAQLLMILSDVEGFLQEGKLVERIGALNHASASAARGPTRLTTKGGMASKLEAARIVGHSGIPMVIARGTRPGVLEDILAGQTVGTLFVPPRNRLTSRKWWIAYALRRPNGTVVIDEGAAQALLQQGKSLLASGIRQVQGQFAQGAFVAVTDQSGTELARGISNYSSSELLRVHGMKSPEIARVLGHATAREVIHRDRLVLARELRHG